MRIAQLTVSGRVGQVPEIKYTKNGSKMVTLRLGVDFGFGDKRVTEWIGVSVFGRNGEYAETLKVGDEVLVLGRFDVRKWKDKQGVTVTSIEVYADRIECVARASSSGRGGEEREAASAVAMKEENVPF